MIIIKILVSYFRSLSIKSYLIAFIINSFTELKEVTEYQVRRLQLNEIKIFNYQEYLIFPRASYTPNGNRRKPNAIHFMSTIFSVFEKCKPILKINKNLNCLFLLKVL